jgi:hypothetical protein
MFEVPKVAFEWYEQGSRNSTAEDLGDDNMFGQTG